MRPDALRYSTLLLDPHGSSKSLTTKRKTTVGGVGSYHRVAKNGEGIG